MGASTSVIILEYVCPALGVCTGNIMFASPVRDCYQAVRAGKGLGTLNPTPWAFMLGNTIGWVAYGYLIENLFVVVANAPGLLMSIWLNLQAVKMQYHSFRSDSMRSSIVQECERLTDLEENKVKVPKDNDQDTEATSGELGGVRGLTASTFSRIVWDVPSEDKLPPLMHDWLVVGNVALWIAVLTLIAFATAFSLETKQLIVGFVVNSLLVVFYGSPLSTIWTVIKSRNAATIHIPTMLTNTFNGVFWAAYGFAVQNWFIALPNSLGASLGVVQAMLCVFFPRRSNGDSSEEQQQQAQEATSDEPTSP